MVSDHGSHQNNVAVAMFGRLINGNFDSSSSSVVEVDRLMDVFSKLISLKAGQPLLSALSRVRDLVGPPLPTR
jgi:hypothetical protein